MAKSGSWGGAMHVVHFAALRRRVKLHFVSSLPLFYGGSLWFSGRQRFECCVVISINPTTFAVWLKSFCFEYKSVQNPWNQSYRSKMYCIEAQKRLLRNFLPFPPYYCPLPLRARVSTSSPEMIRRKKLRRGA